MMLLILKLIVFPAVTAVVGNPLVITKFFVLVTVHFAEVLEISVELLTQEVLVRSSMVISAGKIIVSVEPTGML